MVAIDFNIFARWGNYTAQTVLYVIVAGLLCYVVYWFVMQSKFNIKVRIRSPRKIGEGMNERIVYKTFQTKARFLKNKRGEWFLFKGRWKKQPAKELMEGLTVDNYLNCKEDFDGNLYAEKIVDEDQFITKIKTIPVDMRLLAINEIRDAELEYGKQPWWERYLPYMAVGFILVFFIIGIALFNQTLQASAGAIAKSASAMASSAHTLANATAQFAAGGSVAPY